MLEEADDDTSEQLDELEEEEAASGQPGGVKNYITPRGMAKLKEEYQKLFHHERPKLVETIAWAASNGDRSENADYIYGKRRLREIDRRLRFLGRRLASAVVVTPSTQPKNQVLFGARVTIEDDDGKSFTYRIVGEDEIDVDNRQISWVSPVAKALMGTKVGDMVVIRRPNGEMEVTVVKIEYTDD